MGPFPHDAPPAKISAENPAGTDGFEFVEFAHPDSDALRTLFGQMGFELVARHKSRAIDLYRQGGVNYILNGDRTSFGGRFVDVHGPCAPAMAWRVVDADHALAYALERGAQPYKGETEFDWVDERDPVPAGCGIDYIDHLTNNVFRGAMDRWYQFYQNLFNFRQIRYFDIAGKVTGLYSRALTSPCGKIRIPLNESADDKSQIEEYLHQYKGEGIQHIACGCKDIYATVQRLAARGLAFMPPPPDTYYNRIAARLPGHGEPLEALRASGILIDGETVEGGKPKLLLQIFSKTVIGPIFFEFIERKGDEGFGEGNFRALFESIEADQIERGVLVA
jgi:4-hydroxyphenylpyruvate dioxygenase